MSKRAATLYHPVNGAPEETWEGFSWPAFFFGGIWLGVKQLWGHFIVAIIIIIVTFGFAVIPIWIYYGFSGNSHHRKSLLRKGYMTYEQYQNSKK